MGDRKVKAKRASEEKPQIQKPFDPTEEEIRKRAYEIYLARGSRPGSALQDWLAAEAELKQGRRIFL
jgi:hypothetical protein